MSHQDILEQKKVMKQYRDWYKLNVSKELVDAISSSEGISSDDLTRVIKGGKIEIIRGTYVHPDLIPHITS